MKIKITTSCGGAARSFTAGTEPTVADDVGQDLINAGYAELLDPEAQPVVAMSEPTEPTEPTGE
ncbi:hypothetical protein [Pseudophaeobacter sp.]|uniref:hypothetical protein n=1 Tax=Pseudophaeobacter sp. TaxID=1971739 RepID=UPI003266942A